MSLSLFRKRSFVGIDLGHHAIKAVQLDFSGGLWRLTRVAERRTPPEAIKDGVVVDEKAVGEAIRELLTAERFTASMANISVAGGSVVVRPVRLPKMSEAALRKSIRFEAGRYIPSSVEDSYVEFEIVGDAGDGQMDVLVAAASKEAVQSRVRACEQAGLEVDAVDLEPFAAYRSLLEADQLHDWTQATVALILIGATSTNLSVISHGRFVLTRTLPHGGQTLTDALRTYFKLSEDDAEAGKRQLNASELLDDAPNENPPLRIIHPHLEDLVREVRRSLNYYQSQQTEQARAHPVSRILLTGGGAKLPGIAAYLAGKLGLEVDLLGVLDNPRFVLAGERDIGPGFEYGVATGLAMRGSRAA